MNKLYLLPLFLLCMDTSDVIIFDFNKETTLNSWRVVDDSVMGGRSKGDLTVNKQGNGVFSGAISLENNGGFSSVRYQFKEKDISKYSQVILRIKGDGKKYQFRIKQEQNDYYSYKTTFQTTTDWQTITIDMKEMYPAFRGRTLNIDNLKPSKIEEIAFLVGNKTTENFRLEIDLISLK